MHSFSSPYDTSLHSQDGTTGVPRAEAQPVETEQGAPRSGVQAHKGRLSSLKVRPAAPPVSSKPTFPLDLCTQKSRVPGRPHASSSQPSPRNLAPPEAAPSPGPGPGRGTGAGETYVLNINGELSGALGLLLVAGGLQEAIKRAQ